MLLRDFLPQFLGELFDFLQVFREVFCQHAFLQLLQIRLQGRAEGRQVLGVFMDHLKSHRSQIFFPEGFRPDACRQRPILARALWRYGRLLSQCWDG
jgi:hypothetical protein